MMKANRVYTLDEFEVGIPGTIIVTERKIGVCCPGCGEKSLLSLHRKDDKLDPGWNWDEETQSLTPSIDHDTPMCGWHGWLTNGEFDGRN